MLSSVGAVPPCHDALLLWSVTVWGQAEVECLDESSLFLDDLISLGLTNESPEGGVLASVGSGTQLVSEHELGFFPDSDGLGSGIMEEDGSPLVVVS